MKSRVAAQGGVRTSRSGGGGSSQEQSVSGRLAVHVGSFLENKEQNLIDRSKTRERRKKKKKCSRLRGHAVGHPDSTKLSSLTMATGERAGRLVRLAQGKREELLAASGRLR